MGHPWNLACSPANVAKEALVYPDGQPHAEPPMNRGPEDLFPRLLEACPFRVVEASLGERHGDTDGRVIRVNRDLPPGEKAATLLHEWAHALLHFDEAGRGLPRGVKELEAEAVAYVVGTRLGLEMVGARDYILSWAGREAQDLLREVLPRLYRAVEAILGQVEVGKPNCPYPCLRVKREARQGNGYLSRGKHLVQLRTRVPDLGCKGKLSQSPFGEASLATHGVEIRIDEDNSQGSQSPFGEASLAT